MANEFQKPFWYQANPDIIVCRQNLEFLSLNFKMDSLAFPDVKEKRRIEIIKGWQGRQEQAGMSLDRDLENLSLEHDRIKGNYMVAVGNANRTFDMAISHYPDMEHEHSIGELSETKFLEFLKSYGEIISKNKEVGLNGWSKPIAKKILIKIAEIEEKEHNK